MLKDESNSSTEQISSSISKIVPPKQWPPQVCKLYEPVRELGRGGFASVLLARNKISGEYHAIKIVGSKVATRKEMGYALREIDILKELDHPNIMHLREHWMQVDSCAAVMALSYAEGPTLQYLLKRGGKLSIRFARVVSAQLIEALSYLHSRAVVHRDIKPDNIVIGPRLDQESDIYDDPQVKEPEDVVDWKNLLQQWHVTLVDFGFARALTPDDLKKAGPNRSTKSGSTTLDYSTGSSRSAGKSLSRSLSRKFGRNMSALGNQLYAAPEIVNHVKVKNDSSDRGDTSRHPIDVTKTMSEHVAYYGLMADAYSAGNTIKYMITGVSPDENVTDVIALENNPVVVVCRFLGGCLGKPEETGRKVQYRPIKDIPKETLHLIKGLTNPDPSKRTSIRTARRYPWIDDALEGYTLNATQKISFLSFAKKEDDTNASTRDDKETVEA